MSIDVNGKNYNCDVHNGSMDMQLKDGTLERACNSTAVIQTDGTEKDTAVTLKPVTNLYGVDDDPIPRGKPVKLNRQAVPHVRVCEHHRNWPFSDDARRFAKSPAYQKRLDEMPPAPAGGGGSAPVAAVAQGKRA